MESSHIISFIVMSTLVVTISTLGHVTQLWPMQRAYWREFCASKLVRLMFGRHQKEYKITIKVEVKRNGTSIPWDENLDDHKSSKFKELALTVKNQLREDLNQLPGISEIKVKKFEEKNGNTSCEFECKIDDNDVEKEDIEKALNGTVDIGGVADVSYTKITTSLQLSSVSWIEAYNDKNSPDYKNLTSRILDALSEVYQDNEDVVGFEIITLSKASDGSVMVQYDFLVNPASELKKKDLDETFDEFTKNNGFGGMATGSKPVEQEQDESEESQSEGPVTGLVVFGALIMCVVIIAFLGRVLWQNWRHKMDSLDDEARFEAYKQAERRPDTVHVPVTAIEETNIDIHSASYRRISSVIVDVRDNIP